MAKEKKAPKKYYTLVKPVDIQRKDKVVHYPAGKKIRLTKEGAEYFKRIGKIK